MKTTPCFAAFICAGLLLSGCAQFQHQTREDEPHAVVLIARYPTPSPVNGVVKSLDGQPVREGASYRVRPGSHEIVVRFVEASVASGNPVYFGSPPTGMDQPGNLHISEDGRTSTTGLRPFNSMQPLSMSVENRSRREEKRNFKAVAGRKYKIRGTTIAEERVAKS
jgi:hypothetical protein